MTIRKKLILSNVLMIVVPAVLSLLFGIFLLETAGHRYWDSLEDMYSDKNAVYSAQSVIYAYRDDFMEENWAKYAQVEEDAMEVSTEDMNSLLQMDRELSDMGYHFRIQAGGETVYSTLTQEELDKITSYFETSYKKIKNLTLSDDTGSIIKNVFTTAGEKMEIDAVCSLRRQEKLVYTSYLKKHILFTVVIFLIFVGFVVFVTDVILSRWTARMILVPLNILQKGSQEIADGNLNFLLSYDKKDEFGEVCRDFDAMRGHLKESVETQMQYEEYRKDLIVGISHDLRTPLTSIKGYVEGLKDGIANTPEKRERYYDAIHIRSLDMESLVDSLSTFARLENKKYKYQLEPVNMDEYLRQLIKEYSQEAQTKRAILLYDNDAGQSEILADIQELHRVFINLFENSIKYRILSETVIRIHMENRNGNLWIRVSDNGPGVREEELHKIFNTFYRSDESRTNPEGGSGLGLSIVKQIIEGHKGTIKAANKKGLVMIMTFPLYKPNASMEKDLEYEDKKGEV